MISGFFIPIAGYMQTDGKIVAEPANTSAIPSLEILAQNLPNLIANNINLIRVWAYYYAARFGLQHFEDLVQEGRIAIAEAAGSYRPGRAPFPYYARIFVRRKMVDFIRSYTNPRLLVVSLDEKLEEDFSFEDALGFHDDTVQHNETRELFRDLLKALPARYRDVIYRYYFLDQSQPEIGQALGVSSSRIQKIHQRALQELRLALTRKDRPWLRKTYVSK